MFLLTEQNAKLIKGLKKGYKTFALHLSPGNLSGYETCPKRTIGCSAACLNKAGRGGMFQQGKETNFVQEARKRRTKFFFESRDFFMETLVAEIEKAIKMVEKESLIPAFRLNCTSDISWEKYPVKRGDILYNNVFSAFPDIQFYDYTKVIGRKVSEIPNYHLTFSRSECNEAEVQRAIEAGMNVSVVFRVKRSEKLPESWYGMRVVDGDVTDLRFLDPKNSVVGLRAKGTRGINDRSGFVIHF